MTNVIRLWYTRNMILMQVGTKSNAYSAFPYVHIIVKAVEKPTGRTRSFPFSLCRQTCRVKCSTRPVLQTTSLKSQVRSTLGTTRCLSQDDDLFVVVPLLSQCCPNVVPILSQCCPKYLLHVRFVYTRQSIQHQLRYGLLHRHHHRQLNVYERWNSRQ